jgi:hypothetical protein
MRHVIAYLGQESELGGLECPSPASDARGKYRIGLDSQGRPEIQRMTSKREWIPVTL